MVAELGTEAAIEVIAEIAKGDASAGWVFGLIASHFWLVCLFPPRGAGGDVGRATPT